MTLLESDATLILKDEPIDPEIKAAMIEGLKKSAALKFGTFDAIQNTQQRCFEKRKEALQLLLAHWGHWRGKDGAVIWDTQARLDEFTKTVSAIQSLENERAALERQFNREQQ